MEKIIEKLFDIHMETESLPFGKQNKENADREWEFFDLLYEKLDGETKTAFREYTNFCAERQKDELKAVYKHGFQAAVKMLIECIKD